MVFPDSDVVIYLVERHPDFGPMAEAALADLQSGPLVTCAMVKLEALTLPIRKNDLRQIDDHRDFFSTASILFPISDAIFERALTLRAKHRLKSPDAIKLACAIASGCDVFLINDRDYKSVTEIRIVSIRNYAAP